MVPVTTPEWVREDERWTGCPRTSPGCGPDRLPAVPAAANRADLSAVTRGYIGVAGRMTVPCVYSGQGVPAWGINLERFFTMCPFLNSRSWGLAFDE